MPLARAINHAHSAASYFLQDFVIAQPRSRAALSALGRAFTHARDRIRQAWGDHVLTTNAHLWTRSHKSDVGGQRFVLISVHSWLRRCLSARGQRRAQVSDFVFYIARIF